MKPFDLEAAKRGEPIMTRDGREAKFIAYVPEARFHKQVVVYVQGEVRLNYIGGQHTASTGVHSLDLFMAPKKRTVWVNFYEDLAYYYDSEHEADSDASQFTKLKRIGGKAYPVEIEE